MVDSSQKGKVLLLHRTIYGLKQAAHEFWSLLSGTFKSLGYQAADASSCLWVKHLNGETCIACHHVDDCAVTASCDAIAFELRDALQKRYGITDGGELTFHLGMNVAIKRREYACISQGHYIRAIAARFGMATATSVPTPMVDGNRISLDDSPEAVDEELRQTYMEMVGSLNYVSYMTRGDIAYACSQLGTVLQRPGPAHIAAAKRVIRYLIGTQDLGLVYRADPWTPPGFDHPIKGHEVIGFTDADWAGEFDSRLSTTCYLTFMASGPISWKARKQKVHAASSAESELIAMTGGARDIMYVRATLANLGIFAQSKPTILMSDSSAAIAIADKPGMREKTKHIALRYFQVRELQRTGVVKVCKIGTDYNPADIGTKALGPVTFHRHLSVLVGKNPGKLGEGGSAMSKEPKKGGVGNASKSGNETGSASDPVVAAIAQLESAVWQIVRRR